MAAARGEKLEASFIHEVMYEDVVYGRGARGAFHCGVVGGGATWEDPPVGMEGSGGGEHGREWGARRVCGVEITGQECVIWLHVLSEVLHAARLLHPFTIGDVLLEVDVAHEEVTDVPKGGERGDPVVPIVYERGLIGPSTKGPPPGYQKACASPISRAVEGLICRGGGGGGGLHSGPTARAR